VVFDGAAYTAHSELLPQHLGIALLYSVCSYNASIAKFTLVNIIKITRSTDFHKVDFACTVVRLTFELVRFHRLVRAWFYGSFVLQID
jgi:hypothetical protein